MGEYTSHYITRHRVAVHFPGSCSLQLTDGKKTRRCFVQFPIAIFQIFCCKMWPQHTRFVFGMSTNTQCIWKMGPKRGIYCEMKFYTELQIEGEKIISFVIHVTENTQTVQFSPSAFAQFSFSSQLCFSVFLCNCSPFQKNWSTHLSSKKNQSSGDCGFWHSLFVSVSGAYRTFIVVSRNFSTFHTFSAMKVFFSFQCFASDQYCVCVWQPLAPAGHQPVPGFLREHKNALGRILIRNSSKFGQKFGPFCQSSSDGECFHYGAAVGPPVVGHQSLLSRLKVLKQFTELKIWSKRETIRRRFGSFWRRFCGWTKQGILKKK